MKRIDKVTTERLDKVLRLCNIQIHTTLLDKIIDVVELIEDKGGKTSLKDISKLEVEWQKHAME